MIDSFAGTGGDGYRPSRNSWHSKRRFKKAAALSALDLEYHTAIAWDSFEAGAVLGSGARIFPAAYCANLGERTDITIGDGFVCRGVLRREAFGGSLSIGRNVYVGDHVVISCGDQISIGDDVLIAFGVRIFDNDTHPVDAEKRRIQVARMLADGHYADADVARAPISIESGAWIGQGAIILKGVTVGAGAIVGAGSVVTKSVRSNTAVAGNPARLIREIG